MSSVPDILSKLVVTTSTIRCRLTLSIAYQYDASIVPFSSKITPSGPNLTIFQKSTQTTLKFHPKGQQYLVQKQGGLTILGLGSVKLHVVVQDTPFIEGLIVARKLCRVDLLT